MRILGFTFSDSRCKICGVKTLTHNELGEREAHRMRKEHRIQRALTEPWLDLPYSKELEAINDLLTSQPTIGELAAQDLFGGESDTGRPGMTGEEVLRALVLKQINQWSYTELWFQLHDSQTSRRFMGLGMTDLVPARSRMLRVAPIFLGYGRPARWDSRGAWIEVLRKSNMTVRLSDSIIVVRSRPPGTNRPDFLRTSCQRTDRAV